MSETDYARAVAEFMRQRGVTRCPTAYVVPTRASLSDEDRAALRNHDAAREAARQMKLRSMQELFAP